MLAMLCLDLLSGSKRYYESTSDSALEGETAQKEE
jgi:hypothetical protein